MTPLDWRTRARNLQPAGMVAFGAVARSLVRALAARPTDRLEGLRAVATADLLVVLGEDARLPWADGVRYCAAEPDAPGLWLPTWLVPAPAPDLLQAALQRRTGNAVVLLWPDPAMALGLDGALPLRTATLEWLDGVVR